MSGRKIGVGFNQPRVLGGAYTRQWREYYDFMRRITRLRPPCSMFKSYPNQIWGINTVESMRKNWNGHKARKGKRQR